MLPMQSKQTSFRSTGRPDDLNNSKTFEKQQ